MDSAAELKHMIDISIDVELNILNFNKLNSLLHIIVRRLCPCSINQSSNGESQGN